MIKITPRAEITNEFQEAIRTAYRDYLLREKEHAEMDPRGATHYLKLRAPGHVHALSVLKTNHSDSRCGMEYEITLLRALPFTRFAVVDHDGTYLAGITRPIDMKDPDGGRMYHLGPYAVYAPISALTEGRTDGFHFIPTVYPQSNKRHPHHKVDSDDHDTHPLEKRAYTCWGEFGGPVSGLVDTINIPELFRHLYLYVSRYNPHSPLVRSGIRGLDFLDRIEVEAA